MNPQFRIDLNALFNKAFKDDKAFRNQIRPILSDPEFRRLFSDNVINKIVERTQAGFDKNNQKTFGAYSPSYKKSVTFKIYKGMKRTVDLTLTGDMLSDLRQVKKKGDIVIELGDDTNKAKAYGHIHAFRGHPHIGKGENPRPPKRDFLGLPEEDQIELLRLSVKESINIFSVGSEKVQQAIAEATDIGIETEA